MKKFIWSFSALLVLLACNKEKKVVESEVIENDSIDFIQNEIPVEETAILTEYTPDQVSDFLTTKNNDTLYVTNFFATWCGPCMREIPHFKEKMEELKNQPVKFTFVSLDRREDWDTKVKQFGEENNLTENIILLDGKLLNQEFFHRNFKTWDGSGIPFTYMKKRDKTDEYMSMMTKEMLTEKINALL